MVEEVEEMLLSSWSELTKSLLTKVDRMKQNNQKFAKELTARISYLNRLRKMPNKEPAKSSGKSSPCTSNSATRMSKSSRETQIVEVVNQELMKDNELHQEVEPVQIEMRSQSEDSDARVEQLEPAEVKDMKHRQRDSFRKMCPLCNLPHQIFACDEFKALRQHDRFILCKEKNLCFNCLKHSHKSKYCHWKGRCSLEGCRRKHSTLLHREPFTFVTRASLPNNNDYNIQPQPEGEPNQSSGIEQMPIQTIRRSIGAVLKKCGKRFGETVRTVMSEIAQNDGTSVFRGQRILRSFKDISCK